MRSAPRNKCALTAALPLSLESEAAARIAGLRYVTVDGPGIRRLRRGTGWSFVQPDGTVLRDRAELRRIRGLVIPPAWTQVWICPSPTGHLQAVGIDQRGRRQYRYHAGFREVRDATKFSRMAAFGAALPKIREHVEADLALSGLPRRKIIATAVRLLETTSVRVGNEEYARENESFGLTTLQNRHVEVEGSQISFRFRGKSGQMHTIQVRDRRVARIVRECQDLPGQELFQYLDEAGENCKLCSEDVNSYLKEVAGEEFTAKDFRTWNGTLEAFVTLRKSGPAGSESEAKKSIVECVKSVARTLGNRPATCRKYYIHPGVLEAFQDGTIFEVAPLPPAGDSKFALDADERALLALVQTRAYVPAAIRRRPRAA